MYRIHIKDTGRSHLAILQTVTEKLRLSIEYQLVVRGQVSDIFTKIISRKNIHLIERWKKNSIYQSGYYRKTFLTSLHLMMWSLLEFMTPVIRRVRRGLGYYRLCPKSIRLLMKALKWSLEISFIQKKEWNNWTPLILIKASLCTDLKQAQ